MTGKVKQWMRESGIRTRPFAWGETDCNTVVLEWVSWLAGDDFVGDVLHAYSDAASAAEFAVGLGETLTERVVRAGFLPVDTMFPRAGDVVIVRFPGEAYERGHVAIGSRTLLSADEVRGVYTGPVDSLRLFDVLRKVA